jgi:hypothetical protein
MSNAILMKELKTIQDLMDVEASLVLLELSAVDEVLQRLSARNVFHKDIRAFYVLEEPGELDHVRMMEPGQKGSFPSNSEKILSNGTLEYLGGHVLARADIEGELHAGRGAGSKHLIVDAEATGDDFLLPKLLLRHGGDARKDWKRRESVCADLDELDYLRAEGLATRL